MWSCASSVLPTSTGFGRRLHCSAPWRSKHAFRAADRAPRSHRGVSSQAVAEGGVSEDAVGDEDEIPTVSRDAVRWTVRPADNNDLADIVQLAASSGVDWSAKQVTEEVTKGNTLVAVQSYVSVDEKEKPSSQVVGFVVAWVVGDVEVQILEVATHEDHRRKGVAMTLIQSFLDRNPSCDAFLECRVSNDAALNLYVEKFGFKKTNTRKDYYKNPIEDAVLLTRTPPAVSARELTRLLAGLSPEDARKPAPKTPEEEQRGTTMHAQDYPRRRPAFTRNRNTDSETKSGSDDTEQNASRTTPWFKMRNRIRK